MSETPAIFENVYWVSFHVAGVEIRCTSQVISKENV
jgi:hypothetical protein